MNAFIVMDYTGDSRHFFDTSSEEGLRDAETFFREMKEKGFTAATRAGPGELRVARMLDPTAEETLFYPRLVGG
jgi:hypothetical protein